MFGEGSVDIPGLVSTYAIPWAINIAFALLVFVIGRIVAKVLTNVVRKMMAKANTDEILINFISTIVYTILLLVVVIASLNQLGVDTTSLLALIGAAGLAVGLALQGSLQNFAAGVMLIVFRPFKIGDFVDAGGASGSVEKITIFNTIMKTPDNKEVIVPNGQIYGSTITNYSAKDTRRVDMVFGIGYGDDIRKAKAILNQILENDDRVLSDPAPLVAVGELADSSVNFNVRPWVKSGDYWAVMADVTERVKLAFDQNGISIPFPQMDVYSHIVKEQNAA